MPKKPPAQQEGRIILAINAFKNKKIKSIRVAARSFDIPLSTLHKRLQGRPEAFTTYTKAFKLTQIEEESLVQWIISMGNRGMPPRPSQVQAMAYTLISKQGRYAELTTKYIRKYSYQQAKCEDPKLIQQWFNQFLETKLQYGILDEDIYNFDETGFAMGIIATIKVVIASECFGKPLLLQLGNREWVTVIESISADGWVLPPLIIFKVLKRMYGAQLENKVYGGIQHIDKEDFLEIYPIQLLKEQYSLTTPIKTAINQAFKGYEMAMHSVIFIVEDNKRLRAENAKMQQKLRRSRKQLVHTGSLTRQEAQELAQSSATVQNASEAVIPSTSANLLQVQSRRPQKCSECGNVGHNRLKCPNLASH
ncbi:hypothetical protein B7463_g3102, partial [Scytalidium lignicola]